MTSVIWYMYLYLHWGLFNINLKGISTPPATCECLYGKCSQTSKTKKERTPWIYFLSSQLKQREVINFAKGGNLIASLCKFGYFPHGIFGIFLFEIKILLYKVLEHLPFWVLCTLAVTSPVCFGERGGSVVECRTPEREVGGSIPTVAMLCPWARHFTPRKYWLIT